MAAIRIENGADGITAWPEGRPDLIVTGSVPAEVVGRLIFTYPTMFGAISVTDPTGRAYVHPKPKAEPRKRNERDRA